MLQKHFTQQCSSNQQTWCKYNVPLGCGWKVNCVRMQRRRAGAGLKFGHQPDELRLSVELKLFGLDQMSVGGHWMLQKHFTQQCSSNQQTWWKHIVPLR
jgi:hypothetical protein